MQFKSWLSRTREAALPAGLKDLTVLSFSRVENARVGNWVSLECFVLVFLTGG